MKQPIKIAIVDDNFFFRKGLAAFIGKYEDFKIIIEASDGIELIDAFKKQKPDVILLDLKMPGMDGIKTTEYLSEYYPNIKILILTGYDDEGIYKCLIEKGAHGFLLKSTDINKVPEAIYSVTRFKYYFADLDFKKLIKTSQLKKETSINQVKLTEREREIIDLICQQHTNKEISDILFLSPRTVDNYRDKILQKTNSRNTAGIVMYAVQVGLTAIK